MSKGGNNRLSHDEYCRRVKEKYGDKFSVVSKYTTIKNDICIKCVECGYTFTINAEKFLYGATKCVCDNKNVIAFTHPYIAKLFANPNDAYAYSYGTKATSDFICPDCGKILRKRIHAVCTRGLNCEYCSTSISLGERIMCSFLRLNQNVLDDNTFIHDKPTSWSNNKRYDFIFSVSNNMYIVEVDGWQHNHQNESAIISNNLEYQKENDYIKEQLAFNNGVHKDNFIRIDASQSNFDYIKNSIIGSKLSKIFDLKSFNWDECFENTTSPKIKIVCDLWNSGIHSYDIICNTTGYSRPAVLEYLKSGALANMCDYKEDWYIKKVKCVNDNLIFNGQKEAGRYYKIKSYLNIRQVCDGERSYCGKHPITGESLKWVWV